MKFGERGRVRKKVIVVVSGGRCSGNGDLCVDKCDCYSYCLRILFVFNGCESTYSSQHCSQRLFLFLFLFLSLSASLHLSLSLFVCFPNPFLPCRVVALLSLGSRGDAIASSFVPRAIVSLGIGVITST